MREPIVSYERFDVVVVPFTFTEKVSAKRGPALVLSSSKTFNKKAGHSVRVMITSAQNDPWSLDTHTPS
ncbi:MAG: type II toxin-antitoxin system PemK/MazF family toxin [Gammaproteobacteria bacterium]